MESLCLSCIMNKNGGRFVYGFRGSHNPIHDSFPIFAKEIPMKKLFLVALAMSAFFLFSHSAEAKHPLVCTPVKVSCTHKVCSTSCQTCKKKCDDSCKFKLYCRAMHPICGQWAYQNCVKTCQIKNRCAGSCCKVVTGHKVCKRTPRCVKVVCVRAPCPPVCSCVTTPACTPCR